MSRFVLASLAAALLCACATRIDSNDQFDDMEFRTGSNIPRLTPASDRVTRFSREAMQDFQRGTGSVMKRDPDSRR
jgi:hypothetical protein